jgi:hypothetical protein
MRVSRLKAKAERKGERGLAAVNGAAARGAAYAKAQAGELTAQGQRFVRRVDGQIDRYTGRRTAGWLERMSQRLTSRHWTNVAVAALALFALAMLV